jgi:succinate-semialdehyde dehydrogenase/glutarate-semialdehyde dehydrogenase
VWDKTVNFGPLYSPRAFEKLTAQVKDALGNGGKVYYGGVGVQSDVAQGPNFYPPTIITGASSNSLFMTQETFGPLAFLVPFDTEEQVIALANNTNAGLAAYFYTEDISRMYRVRKDMGSTQNCHVTIMCCSEDASGSQLLHTDGRPTESIS